MPRTCVHTGIAGFVLVGLVVALGLAAFASPFASSQPDGLSKVAADHGLDASARDTATKDAPIANYAVRNVDNEDVAKGLAGVIGVTITLLAAVTVFGGLRYFVRRSSSSSPEPAAST